MYEWPTPNPAPKPTRHWGLDKSYKITRVRSYEFVRISHLIKYVQIGREIALVLLMTGFVVQGHIYIYIYIYIYTYIHIYIYIYNQCWTIHQQTNYISLISKNPQARSAFLTHTRWFFTLSLWFSLDISAHYSTIGVLVQSNEKYYSLAAYVHFILKGNFSLCVSPCVW